MIQKWASSWFLSCSSDQSPQVDPQTDLVLKLTANASNPQAPEARLSHSHLAHFVVFNSDDLSQMALSCEIKRPFLVLADRRDQKADCGDCNPTPIGISRTNFLRSK